MGKTTDKFLIIINMLKTDCEKLYLDFAKVVAEESKLLTALSAVANATPLDRSALGDVTKKLGTVQNAKSELKKKLKVPHTELVKQTDLFEQYVIKKDKSKNPFKSKKSLPTAKGLVAVAKTLIAKNNTFLA